MVCICNGERNHNGEEQENTLGQSTFQIQRLVCHHLVSFLGAAALQKSLSKDNIKPERNLMARRPNV